MSEIVFYYHPLSSAMFTIAVLDEIEHALSKTLAQRVEMTLHESTRTPEYLGNVNPNGRVPAIVHNGVSVWESAAIAMYLGETFGVDSSPRLYPPPGPQRAEAMKWIVWTNVTYAETLRRLYAAKGMNQLPEAAFPRTEAAQEQGQKDLIACLDVLDGALKGRKYILGDEYSLADTHLWCSLVPLSFMGISLEKHSNIQAWKARIDERPALKKG